MRVVLCLALLLFPQNPSAENALPDLEAMFQKDEALRRLVIVYWPPVQKDWQQAFLYEEMAPSSSRLCQIY